MNTELTAASVRLADGMRLLCFNDRILVSFPPTWKSEDKDWSVCVLDSHHANTNEASPAEKYEPSSEEIVHGKNLVYRAYREFIEVGGILV